MPPLQTLSVVHFQIAHLLAQGRSQTEVVRKLNISPGTIRNCLETPEFQETLESLREEYAQRLAESFTLPLQEMQKKVNEEALGALSRVVTISERDPGDKTSQTVLNANLALLDRASNMPKTQKAEDATAQKALFDVSIVQLVLETAKQVGDTTILRTAERALGTIDSLPVKMTREEILEAEFHEKKASRAPNPSLFQLRSLDEALSTLDESEEDF